ncbi:MAG: lipoprotein [Exilibacterium sp.]
MKHIFTAIATLIPLVMALSGCGQKGPLYLPQKEVPQKEIPQKASTQQKMPQPQVSPQGPENGNAEQEQNEDEEQP